jgi:7-cyano-7-deazaguanine synthase in queuosine biosynthesis
LAKGVWECTNPVEERPAQFLEPRVRALAPIVELQVPYDLTWTCYEGGVADICVCYPCGAIVK